MNELRSKCFQVLESLSSTEIMSCLTDEEVNRTTKGAVKTLLVKSVLLIFNLFFYVVSFKVDDDQDVTDFESGTSNAASSRLEVRRCVIKSRNFPSRRRKFCSSLEFFSWMMNHEMRAHSSRSGRTLLV